MSIVTGMRHVYSIFLMLFPLITHVRLSVYSGKLVMQTSEKVSEFDDALFSETPFTIFSETPFTIFVMILQPIVNVQLLPIASVLPCDYTPALAGVLSLLSLAGKICPRAVPASYGLALVNIAGSYAPYACAY